MDLVLATPDLACALATEGGAVWRLDALVDGARVPLLRPPPAGSAREAAQAGCFPLVPFGNRAAGNAFEHDGRDYRLAPNVTGDAHYVHGDGWLGAWAVAYRTAQAATLFYEHAAGPASPYAYRVRQHIALDGSAIRLSLAVENRGEASLPFGLGWHPFFPLTPRTTLAAPARGFWTERAGWLPDRRVAPPAELDFTSARPLPRRWINNGFDGWTGEAEIVWPERGLGVTLRVSPQVSRYFLFTPDAAFDPDNHGAYFCFEPMSHDADGHARPAQSGLVTLSQGESLAVWMEMRWSRLVAGR